MMNRLKKQQVQMNTLRNKTKNQMKTPEGELNKYILDLELHLDRRVATENNIIVKLNDSISKTINEKRLKELQGVLQYHEGRLKSAEKDRNAFLQMSREEKKNKFETEKAYIAEQQKLYSTGSLGGRRKRTLRKHKRTLRKHKRRTHRR